MPSRPVVPDAAQDASDDDDVQVLSQDPSPSLHPPKTNKPPIHKGKQLAVVTVEAPLTPLASESTSTKDHSPGTRVRAGITESSLQKSASGSDTPMRSKSVAPEAQEAIIPAGHKVLVTSGSSVTAARYAAGLKDVSRPATKIPVAVSAVPLWTCDEVAALQVYLSKHATVETAIAAGELIAFHFEREHGSQLGGLASEADAFGTGQLLELPPWHEVALKIQTGSALTGGPAKAGAGKLLAYRFHQRLRYLQQNA